MTAAVVTVRLPAVLAEIGGGERQVEVEGSTLREALADLIRLRPGLALHFFDDAGTFRRHILCFHGEDYAREDEDLDRPVEPGGTITILNSVAGG